MSANKLAVADRFAFRGNIQPAETGTASPVPWRKKTTKTAGSPGVTGVADGIKLALDTANEVQNLCLYFDDVLTYDIDQIETIEFVAKVGGAAISNSTVVFGVASARNDNPDSIAAHALFRLDGSLALKCESDDGVTDNDDVSAGLTLTSDEWTRFVIDFASGTKTVEPGPSKGGKADVRFFAGASALRRVAENTSFDMSGYSAGLQPIVQISKTSSADDVSITIAEICVTTKQPV